MISASRPPTRKKTSAVTPYRTPIRLWSTVVTQLHHPLVAVGRASRRRGRGAMPYSPSPATEAIGSQPPPSLQRLEIRDQRVDLVLCEPEVRHVRSGLDRRRIVQPVAEVAGVVLEGGARERGPAGEVRQVGADGPLRPLHPIDRVAAHSAAGREDLLALRRERAGRWQLGRFRLLFGPCLELGGALR